MIGAGFPGLWHTQPGLAGGIDKEGSQAVALLSIGFGSVDFGTVTPLPEPGHNPGVGALVARLSALHRPRENTGTVSTRIGISLGAGINAAPSVLAAEWLAGMRAAWAVADYLCFNLSARAYRPLLAAQNAPLLVNAIASIIREGDCLTVKTGRRVGLALKLPLGQAGGHWPALLKTIAGMALDALIVVLPEDGERLKALSQLASFDRGQTMLVAVGGIRTADDVRAVLAAGADGIQVHSAFIERGADCLPPLLQGMSVGA